MSLSLLTDKLTTEYTDTNGTKFLGAYIDQNFSDKTLTSEKEKEQIGFM